MPSTTGIIEPSSGIKAPVTEPVCELGEVVAYAQRNRAVPPGTRADLRSEYLLRGSRTATLSSTEASLKTAPPNKSGHTQTDGPAAQDLEAALAKMLCSRAGRSPLLRSFFRSLTQPVKEPAVLFWLAAAACLCRFAHCTCLTSFRVALASLISAYVRRGARAPARATPWSSAIPHAAGWFRPRSRARRLS